MIGKLAVLVASIAFTACGGGGGGGQESSQQPSPTPSPTSSPSPSPSSAPTPTPEPTPESRSTFFEYDRTETDWAVRESVDQLSGDSITTLTINDSSIRQEFEIVCNSNGNRSYRLDLNFVTTNGAVNYRIGHHRDIVIDTWVESNGYQRLTSPDFDLQLLQQIFLDNRMVFRVNKYGAGGVDIIFTPNGLPAVVDQTRSACNWPLDLMPEDNDWGSPVPSTAPEDAIEATYIAPREETPRIYGWRAQNKFGQTKLLTRVGEFNEPCGGQYYRSNSIIADGMFLVEQNGQLISATAGTDLFHSTCDEPFIMTLNGDYDANSPLKLIFTDWSTSTPASTRERRAEVDMP